jgi:hypothetical protein
MHRKTCRGVKCPGAFFRKQEMTMSTSADIHNLDDERLIREGEAAVDGYNKDVASARARIMPMARGLLAARRKYPANRDFGDWLQTSSYRELGADARAALIYIGQHDAFASRFIRTTHLTSPELIADAIRDLLPLSEPPKTAPRSDQSAESPHASAPAAKNDEPETKSCKSQGQDEASSKLTGRSALSRLPRADEIAKMFTHEKTRTTLGQLVNQRGGLQSWKLILEAYDNGLITKTERVIDHLTAVLLFPSAPPRQWGLEYKLDNSKHRKQIKETLLPAMIACRDNLHAEPARIREILAEYEAKQRAKAQTEHAEKHRTQAVSKLPSSEQELIIFGRTVWPRLDNLQGEYNYDQVRAAIWTFRDLDSWNKLTTDNSVGSRGLRIRLTCKWINEYLMRNDSRRENPVRRILGLIQWFSKLMEQAPEAECKWPPYPSIEAEW